MNQYPLWRYILIIILIVGGGIYAAPNFYGDSPAIQISPTNAMPVTSELGDKIKQALQQQKIPYVSVVPSTNSYLIRFNESAEQLESREVLQAVLGNAYTVALNLAPNTPHWLRTLGAKPMRLGLDLRGGIHFLIYVDVDGMLKTHEQQDVHTFSDELREKMIRYAGMAYDNKLGVIIKFRNQKSLQAALTLLSKAHPDYQFTPSTENNRFQLSAKMSPQALIKLQQYAVAQNMNILRNRVDELGVSQPVIQQQGKNYISVDLPGIQDTARAKSIIGKVATISLRMVDTVNDAAKAAQTGIVPFGSTLFQTKNGPVLVKNNVVLPGSSITSASTTLDQNGRPAVSIQASGSEVARFNRITANNIGKPMATIYTQTKSEKKLVDGKVTVHSHQVSKVISIATIDSALGNSFQIMGMSSPEAAKDLALQLRSGAYVANIVYVSERVVAPTLGKQNIRDGVLACEVGSLLVILFMLFYYRLFGFVTDVALIFNVIFLVAIMSLVGFTMSLPGIAAIVLTVGMAVDANVLINERIREELRNGVSIQASIYAGYERAFVTIVDTHVTTLIVAMVLYALVPGDVKGFAVTLIIGLLCSMVTSIFFTRAFINLIYGRRQVDRLSIGIRVDKKGGN